MLMTTIPEPQEVLPSHLNLREAIRPKVGEHFQRAFFLSHHDTRQLVLELGVLTHLMFNLSDPGWADRLEK